MYNEIVKLFDVDYLTESTTMT